MPYIANYCVLKTGKNKTEKYKNDEMETFWVFRYLWILNPWYLNAYFIVSCLRVSHAKETNIVYISR